MLQYIHHRSATLWHPCLAPYQLTSSLARLPLDRSRFVSICFSTGQIPISSSEPSFIGVLVNDPGAFCSEQSPILRVPWVLCGEKALTISDHQLRSTLRWGGTLFLVVPPP